METGLIYCAHCLSNGKKYIGQTVQFFERRYHSHIKDTHRYDTKFYRTARKYGWENFIWGIVEECDGSQLNEREKYWIEYFDSYRNGLNSTLGGTYNPNRKNKTMKYEIQSPEGIIYKGENLNQFCKRHKLAPGDIWRVISGQILSIHGWKLPSTEIIGDETKAIEYSFVDPNGKIHSGRNVSKISKENDLSISKMHEVLKGKRKSHKGWTKNLNYDILSVVE